MSCPNLVGVYSIEVFISGVVIPYRRFGTVLLHVQGIVFHLEIDGNDSDGQIDRRIQGGAPSMPSCHQSGLHLHKSARFVLQWGFEDVLRWLSINNFGQYQARVLAMRKQIFRAVLLEAHIKQPIQTRQQTPQKWAVRNRNR